MNPNDEQEAVQQPAPTPMSVCVWCTVQYPADDVRRYTDCGQGHYLCIPQGCADFHEAWHDLYALWKPRVDRHRDCGKLFLNLSLDDLPVAKQRELAEFFSKQADPATHDEWVDTHFALVVAEYGQPPKSLTTEQLEEIHAEGPADAIRSSYHVTGPGATFRHVQGKDGHDGSYILIANFAATITDEEMIDDGVSVQRSFVVAARQHNKTPAPVNVPADEFDAMKWVTEKLGADFVVLPGYKDHMRTAIQAHSASVKATVYAHTGWRDIDGGRTYLDADTARLPSTLSRFRLGAPSAPGDVSDVQASLRMLDVAPDAISFPVYAAIWRAPIGDTDFSLHLHGETGRGKTAYCVLAQQHYGAGLDAQHIPASWLSTANSIADTTFIVKDALLLIDEFTPSIAPREMAMKSERIFRGTANAAGRGRLNQKSEQMASRPPRALVLSTGEALPNGESLRARVLSVYVDHVIVGNLTDCQRDAREGCYAAAMALWVEHLADNLDEVRKAVSELAEKATRAVPQGHARTARIIGELLLSDGPYEDDGVVRGDDVLVA